MTILYILVVFILILLFINLIFSYKTDLELKEKLDILEDKILECQRYLNHNENLEDQEQEKEKNISSEISFSKVMSHQIKNKEYEDMFEDYQRGVSVTEIARKYNKGKGEVELILSLKK